MSNTVAEENEGERRQRLNFLADSARAGLFAAGSDIFEQMQAANVREAPAIIMQAASMMVAELHEQIAHQRGADKAKVKAAMLEALGLYFDRYAAKSVQEAVSDRPSQQ